MKKIGKIVVVMAILGAVGGYIYIKSTAAQIGEKAPEIRAKLIDGTLFKLSDLRGEYVVLSFWGSWCGPCRSEAPQIVALDAEYKEKMHLVTMAFEKNAESGRAVSKLGGYSWKYQIIEESSLLLLSQTARDYGVSSIPAIFLISPEGEVMKPSTIAEIDSFLSKL
ncbi:MAG: thiol-disulfide isomerase/thioredoxin [Flavobacteriaceae bacterium]|jgi:thiol-disulfide isomerase/thioredoxin